MHKKFKIYIAVHKNMVSLTIHRELKKKGYNNFVFKASTKLYITQQTVVKNLFKNEKPEYVFM